MNNGHFRYPCGCYMMIEKSGTGIGKSCDQCKYLQAKDREQYTGIKQINSEKIDLRFYKT